MEEIERQSQELLAKSTAVRFVDKAGDSGEVVKLVERLGEAITHYQVSENLFVAPNATDRWKDIATASDLLSNHQPHCEHLPVLFPPFSTLTIGPSFKSSFNTLLNLHEVICFREFVAIFADTRTEILGGEGQVGICYGTVG